MTEIIRPEDGDAWESQVNSEYPEPGLYLGVPAPIYNKRWLHPRQSLFSTVARYTPEHARYADLHPSEDTAALAKGTALHARVLEPDTFDDVVSIGPTKTRKAQDWVRMAAANPDLALVTQAELDAVVGMADRLIRLPDIRRLSIPAFKCVRELSVVADLKGTYPPALDPDCSEFTIRVKGRLDWWVELLKWYIDIKTTRDAREDKFNGSVTEYGYDFQGAFYERLMEAHGKEVKRVLFAVVENVPPFIPALRELKDEARNHGHIMVDMALAQWSWCVKQDEYPAFPPEIGAATLRRYAMGPESYQGWKEILNEQYRT